MDKIPISVVVPTKNEELGIADCLRRLTDFDQVIVVDSDSTDKTCAIAEQEGAETITWTWNGTYPKKKQWCLDHLDLRHPWVLFIDADEYPTPDLISELRNLFSNGDPQAFGAFDIQLDYYFMGRLLRHGHRVSKRALVHKDFCHFPPLDDLAAPGMGEQEGHYQPRVTGRKTETLSARIAHHDKDPFATWIARHNRYSDWEAFLARRPALASEVSDLRSKRGRRYRRAPFKPLTFFIYSYIVRRGFLDGSAGFNYALANAFYYWQIGIKEKELAVEAV